MDLFDIIWIGIVLLITFGSAIGNWLQKQAEAREAARRRERALMSPGRQEELQNEVAADATGRAPTSRREQLQARAQQRAQMRQLGAAGGAGAQPSNMTMAERIARARAQEAYKKRAEALRAQAGTASPRPTASPPPPSPEEVVRRQLEAAQRRHQEAEVLRQRAARERAARNRPQPQAQAQTRPQTQQAPQARSSQPSRRTTRAAKPAAQPRPSVPRRATSVPSRSRSTSSTAAASSRRSGTTAARRAGSPPQAMGAAGASPASVLSGLSGRSLREAFVLKEILDRPVALRDGVELR